MISTGVWMLDRESSEVPAGDPSLLEMAAAPAEETAAASAGLHLPTPLTRSPSPPAPPLLPDLFPWRDPVSYYQSLISSKLPVGVDMGAAVSCQLPAVSQPDDEPLDLSCNSRSSPPVPVASRAPRRPEAPPPSKKPYTEEELQAALRDIQSGRLGTRRAAVIYGIPRSTLRNKVYRLNAQEKLADAAAAAERESSKATPPPPPPPQRPSSAPEPEPKTAPEPEPEMTPVCQLLQARLTRPQPPAEPMRAVMSWMYSGVLQRALQARESAQPRPAQPPVWDDFVRRMSHERFCEVLAQLRSAGAEDQPTPPPAASSPADLSGSEHDTATPPPPPLTGCKRRLEEPTDAENNNTPMKAAKSSAKGSRPKRGKYRNYNRSHLAEAVRAVQSGEMSVHRAGNYYGVPHSTLEYKVKQRHLDRADKRKRSSDHPWRSASPAPADRVATSGGVMTYSSGSGSPPPLVSSDVLRRLRQDSEDGGLLDKSALARLLGDHHLGGDLSISGITNRAHTAGGHVLQTSQSS